MRAVKILSTSCKIAAVALLLFTTNTGILTAQTHTPFAESGTATW